MSWRPRTLDELREVEPRAHPDGSDNVVHVNREEALLLHQAGATIVNSGRSRVEPSQRTQQYFFEGKRYFWLAGFGGGSSDEPYPIAGQVMNPHIQGDQEFGDAGMRW